jgi:hypothetical protein
MQRSFYRSVTGRAGIAAASLLVLPLVVAQHLNVGDAPGHEARLAVLRDALLLHRPSAFYEVTSFFLPNVAFDVIGLGLTALSGPETAARIFLGFALVLTLAGVAVLGRAATGRWSVVPLGAALVVHNLMIVEGFLNFAFGLALVPWLLALRLKLDGRTSGFAAGAAAAIVLLFCHLSAFGVYAVMSAGMAFAAWRAGRIRIVHAAAWAFEAVPAVLLLLLMPHDPDKTVHFVPLLSKLINVIKVLSSGDLASDIATVAGLAGCAAMLFVARAKLAPPLVPGLIGLGLIYLLLPGAVGHGAFIDMRVPVAIVLIAFAALDVRLPRSALSTALLAFIAIAFVVKQGALAAMWHRVDPVTQSAASAMNALPQGAVIFRTECRPAESVMSAYRDHQPWLTSVAGLAALDGTRMAAGTWAIAGQQPIAVKPAYKPDYDVQAGVPWSVCGQKDLRKVAAKIRALADPHPHYLFVIRPAKVHSVDAELIATGEGFELYNVNSVGSIKSASPTRNSVEEPHPR